MAEEVNRLWIYRMPGLTPKLLYETMVDTECLVNSQLVNLSPEQWQMLKKECAKRLSLPDNWEDIQYEKSIASKLSTWREMNKQALSLPRKEKKKRKK